MDEWTFPVSFYFKVEIDGVGNIGFSEVSGLDMNIKTEHLKEGGSQGYDVPIEVSHGNLTCKKTISISNQESYKNWMSKHFISNGRVDPKNIKVSLLDSNSEPLCTWELTRAYPIKWTAEPFSAQKNELAIETVEFVYHEIKRVL